MNASQLPGGTLQPIPASGSGATDDQWSLLQKCVELSRQWGASLNVAGVTGDPHDDIYTLYSKLDQNIYNISKA